MTYEELGALIAGTTARGCVFSLPSQNYLTVSLTAQDSHGPEGEQITVSMTFNIPPAMYDETVDERRAMRWVYDCLVELARHEVAEDLRFDGERALDPHVVLDPYRVYNPNIMLRS